MGLEILILGFIATARLFPDTELARLFHLHFVERPVEWLAKLERRHLFYLLLTIAIILAAGELIVVLGSADIAFGLAWDLSLYLDAVAAAAVVTLARHVRIAVRLVRARLAMRAKPQFGSRGKRERRSRIQSGGSSKVNDDDPGGAFALAA